MAFEPIAITDPLDPRIEPFRDVRERDLVRDGGFIAEGTVVLDQLLRSSRFRPTALLILRNRLAGLAPRLEGLAPDVPVYVAERGTFDAIAGFPVHRGVLAHAVREGSAEPLDLRRLAASHALIVAAVGISNHDNLGALFRNAAAFGAAAVLLDETSCDPLYRKAIRVSVGAVMTVPWVRAGTGQAMIEALSGAGFECFGLSPHADRTLSGWRPNGATALVLGTEGEGLPAGLRRRLSGLRIEIVPDFDSLNVATAAAIAMHHVYACRERR